MSRLRKTALLAGGAISVAATLSACGNTITANTSFNSVSALVTVTSQVSGTSVNTVVLSGPLVDSQGKAIPKTVFDESCTQIKPIGSPAPTFSCFAIINTGPHAYVASGLTAGPFGQLKSLATPATAGTITITDLATTKTSIGDAQIISIYAAKGLNGNQDRLGKS